MMCCQLLKIYKRNKCHWVSARKNGMKNKEKTCTSPRGEQNERQLRPKEFSKCEVRRTARPGGYIWQSNA